MIIYKSDVGQTKRFKVYEADGETVKDLTGLSVNWKFKDRDGNTLSKSMSVTDNSQGECEFIVTSDIATAAVRWTSQLEITDGGSYVEKTKEFIVDIQEKT